MNTKKQNKSNGIKAWEFVKSSISEPSFIRKTEYKPYMQTRDQWVIIVIKFKRKITYEFTLSLDEYTEYKRLSLSDWGQK